MTAPAMAEGDGLPPAATLQLTPSERFFRYFQHEVTDLQEHMDRLRNTGTSGGERADAVDHCLSGIARLSNEVNDAASYIPAYDQRTYSEAIKALNTKLAAVRASLAPRPKFSFKSGSIFTAKKNESAISLTDAAELASQTRRAVPGYRSDTSDESSFVSTPANESTNEDSDGAAHCTGFRYHPSSSSQGAAVNIHHHDNVHIMLPSSAAHMAGPATVSNLRRCVIDLSTPTASHRPFAGLTLKNVSSSLILCGHVDGAAHVTNVKDSVIVVASRQFRMHVSTNCDVYLLASSRPIIEDCSSIRFASLPMLYMTEQDWQRENNYENVDDFKWLKSEPSPNWSLLDSTDRLHDGVWKDVVPGGPQFGVDDILKAVRIA